MAKPLYVTEDMRDRAYADLEKKFEEMKTKIKAGEILKDSTIKYEQAFKWPEESFDRPVIEFTPEAWIKTVGLVATTSSEIAWHGIVNRIDDLHFVVEDIVMFPQSVTAATVTVDQEEKMKWFCDTFKGTDRNKVRLHGHSHVDMGTTPSGTDMNSRSFIKEMVNDQYYIFMIINKSYSMNITLYDMKTNGIYEKEDMDIVIPFDLTNWMAQQKKDNIKVRENSSYAKKSAKQVSKLPSADKAPSTAKASKSKLKITAEDIRKFVGASYYQAEEILKSLEKEFVNGEVKNEYSALLDEAADLLSLNGNYGYGYGGDYGSGYVRSYGDYDSVAR